MVRGWACRARSSPCWRITSRRTAAWSCPVHCVRGWAAWRSSGVKLPSDRGWAGRARDTRRQGPGAGLAYGLLVGWGTWGPWLFALMTLGGLVALAAEVALSTAGARVGGASG